MTFLLLVFALTLPVLGLGSILGAVRLLKSLPARSSGYFRFPSFTRIFPAPFVVRFRRLYADPRGATQEFFSPTSRGTSGPRNAWMGVALLHHQAPIGT